MSRRKFLLSAALVLFAVSSSLAADRITSVQQLNDPRYRVGADSGGPVLARVMENLPNAQILKYNTFLSQYLALKSGKIDALTANESEFISSMQNGLEHVRILPGYIGDPVPTAAGISGRSKIPGLREKFNAFIAGIKADGTLEDMYKRWVLDNNMNMPVIDVPEKSDIHLTVATTGAVMPFSYYISSSVTGYDIELGRRFAAHIGASIEFKIYDFGSILMALNSGAADIALSNLYVTPETSESVIFSDIIVSVNCIAAVYDDARTSAIPAPDTGNFEAFRGKRIGVPVGSVIPEIVKRRIPDAKMFYFDLIANFTAALEAGKIDAFALDEPMVYTFERENRKYTHSDGNLGTFSNAFIFPKSPENNPLADEIDEFIRRIKSDGTLDEIRAVWFGGDEGRKVLPGYEDFPAVNGTIRIAVNNDSPPFSYVKDRRLAGYEVDIILRFCREKGYRPDFREMSFTSVLPAVSFGKCDIGIGAISISQERAESMRFSEPICDIKILLVVLKQSEQNAYISRKPKYSTLAEFDGKPIGMQPGVIDWEEWAAANTPRSKISYYNTYPDLVSALKTHKIEGFLVDSPVLALMAAEDESITAVDEPVGKPFGYSFCYAKTEAGRKLCDEMSEYIRRIKASGELDSIISKWQGADEGAKVPPDFRSLPATKGTLTYAAEGSYPPFTYYKGTKLAGIDIEIAVGFCREYGYGLKVQTMLFDAMIPAVNSGKIDFTGDFTPSEEHEEAVYFSEPYCSAHSVMACLKAEDSPAQDFDALAGKVIGVQTGTTCAELVPERIPSAKLAYYDSLPDQLTALKAGKVDAVCCSLPAAIFAENEDSRLARINPPLRETYLYPIFSKTEKGRKLCAEYSAFLKTLWENGTIDALSQKWLGNDESIKFTDDYSALPATNGSVIMAADAGMIPFVYVKDNRIVGYDIDLAVMFCREKGYSLEVRNMALTGVISSVKTGKCDFTQSLNKTPERAENTLFTSEPTIKSGNVLLTVKGESEISESAAMYTDKSQLAGKKIGAIMGTITPEIARENVPSADIEQFSSLAATVLALRSGRVDAVCVPVSAARFITHDNYDIAYCGEQLTNYDIGPVFPKTEKGGKLRAQYTEFIRALWDNGTVRWLDGKWFSMNESEQDIDDYSSLPNPNGTLKLASDLAIVPYAFTKDGKIMGYEIELAGRFCRAYGYGLEVMPMSFGEIIPAVASGDCDFGVSSIAYTEERGKSVLFSYPNGHTGDILLVMKSQTKAPPAIYTDLSQLSGKRIGVAVGSMNGQLVKEKIPRAEIVYFDSNSDILPALMTGKIDAISCGLSTTLFMIREGHNVTYLPQQLGKTHRKAAFSNTEKGRRLCREYSDFLRTLWENGTISSLVYKWIDGEDDSQRVIEDYSSLPNPNGTITMAVDPSVTPYVYTKDGRIQGYEIELAVRFCKAKGYGLKVDAMNHNGVLGSLETGKCDFSYGIEYTDEREKSLLLSEIPNTESSNVIVVMKPSYPAMPSVNMKLSDFAGKKIGVVTASNSTIITAEAVPSAKLIHYDAAADIVVALEQGKIDALACGTPTAVFLIRENNALALVSEPLRENYRSAAFVSSDKGQKLREEYSDFLRELWNNGTISKLYDKWIMNNNEYTNSGDYSHLPAEKGTLKMAADVSMVPFVYVKNGRIIGYDVDIAVMFCKAKGYRLEIVPISHSGVLAALRSGKCDFSYAMEYTDERAKSVLFSETPNVEADNVLVVLRPSEKTTPPPAELSRTENTPHKDNEPSFWDDIASSFRKTFIREDRWKLFAEGIMNTMIITVASIFCGMLLGFAAFMLCRTGSAAANVITKISVWLIKGTPIVVLLMILYYVIFGHVDISGIAVAVIAFTLIFGTSVYRMLTFGTGAVDRGQTEAAYALGFTDFQTFFTVILPQAALHFMPSFREEVTMLIKSTSVVGYIAVQDLTKMGDIVRSRTYEAFFPLIAVAVIYFILAGMLNIIVTAVELHITPSRRKPADILRGIDTAKEGGNHD